MSADLDLRAIERALAGRRAEVVDELGRYVSVESGSRDKAGVDRVGRLVAPAFEALGFSLARMSEHTCGDHLVARRTGRGRGRLLALIHLDTVWPQGTLAENPFRVEEGRAYGPGVLDMKGGWVVLLSALRALRDAGWDGLAETAVFMTGDEELGSPAGRPWIEREARGADWALVMESARENGALVVGRGMVGAMYLAVRGITAHATRAQRGASAIHELAHKILALEALTDAERGVLVNVGTVSGGSARQVIPDRAQAAIDVRAPDTDLAAQVVDRIRAIAETRTVAGTEAALTGGITRPAFDRNAGTDRLLALAQRCAGGLGMTVEGAVTRGGSDGNFTAALGIPTLDGLGPEGANGVSRGEYVLVESIPRRAALLAGVIAGLPGLLPP